MEIKEIIEENARRISRLPAAADPQSGRGCAGRRAATEWGGRTLWLPESMLADPEWRPGLTVPEMEALRSRHDFEYWAWRCVRIRHKLTGALVPFALNSPQRKVLAVMEGDRLADRPIRIIILKARQWGGSTLVQVYMAWIQCVHRRGWNSVICAHVKNTAAAIRSMYSTLLACYPRELWSEDTAPALKLYGGSTATREIVGRECTLTIASSMNQEATRGLACCMAHLSEVAFWADSPGSTPEDFVRAVCSGIPLQPLTLIALESTANGTGSFFHREWLRAREGVSDKHPVFVAWHEIEMYRSPVDDAEALWRSLDDYERALWQRGLTLEMIAWYHAKRREIGSADAMKAEFPTDDVEAFVHSGCSVFAPEHIAALRAGCREPAERGEIAGDEPLGSRAVANVRFVADSAGRLEVWERPVKGRWYVAAVDVGGRSDSADWSVIAVMDRTPGRVPEVVAQWRGHIDHDLLAWKAAAIARFYCDALLVVESNTIETESAGQSAYILEQLAQVYHGLYARSAQGPVAARYGFHTNRSTKALIIAGLTGMVRECAYIERDNRACDEMATYTRLPNGAFGARQGCHDDILMTRAIALYVHPYGTSDPADDSRVLLSRVWW